MRATALAATTLQFFCLMLGGSLLQAQSPEDEVLAVINALLISIREADSATAATLFHPEARLVVLDSRQARHEVRTVSASRFIESIGASAGVWEERVWDPEISFDGGLALVWTNYDFHAAGRFSHCGVDAFHLVDTAEGWKIISIIYTRRTSGCESPPGG
jgi:hypothetical protein